MSCGAVLAKALGAMLRLVSAAVPDFKRARRVECAGASDICFDSIRANLEQFGFPGYHILLTL